MHAHWIVDITILLGAAMVLGIVAERLKQSALLGYLTAGLLLGPGGFSLVQSESVESISELGVALLLFTIGLEFSFGRLKTLGAMATMGGLLQVLITGLVVFGACLGLGFGPIESLALGTMVPLSSTACVLRLLADRAELDTVRGRNSLGILLFQDIAVVPLVVLLTVLSKGGSIGEIARDVAWSFMLAGGLIVAFVILSKYVLPRLMDAAAMTKNRELGILLAVATALGSIWAAEAIHLSPALGAFVAGMLLAETPFSTQIRADIGSFRTLFVTLFFTAIGMLARIEWIPKYIVLLPFVVLAMLFVKVAVIAVVSRIFRVTPGNAVATGLLLGQVGEFSFVLAQIANGGSLIAEATFEVFLLATFATLFITPFLITIAPKASEWVEKRFPDKSDSSKLDEGAEGGHGHIRNHVIVIGYGPAGESVVLHLRRFGVPVVVIDLNPRGVQKAKQNGVATLLGDASRWAVLEHANLDCARALVVTLPDAKAAEMVLQQARANSPHVPLLARARYHIHTQRLSDSGATVVLDEEVTMGQVLSEEIMKHITLPSSMSRVDVPINL